MFHFPTITPPDEGPITMNIEQTILERIAELRTDKAAQVRKNIRLRWWPWSDKVAGQRKVDAISSEIFDLGNDLATVRKVRALSR